LGAADALLVLIAIAQTFGLFLFLAILRWCRLVFVWLHYPACAVRCELLDYECEYCGLLQIAHWPRARGHSSAVGYVMIVMSAVPLPLVTIVMAMQKTHQFYWRWGSRIVTVTFPSSLELFLCGVIWRQCGRWCWCWCWCWVVASCFLFLDWKLEFEFCMLVFVDCPNANSKHKQASLCSVLARVARVPPPPFCPLVDIATRNYRRQLEFSWIIDYRNYHQARGGQIQMRMVRMTSMDSRFWFWMLVLALGLFKLSRMSDTIHHDNTRNLKVLVLQNKH
jgi:hypothetical protein